MKKLFFLLELFIFLHPTIIFSQKEFYNLDFEKTDTIGKSIVKWQYETYSMGTKFIIENSNASTGNNCLFIKKIRPDEPFNNFIVLPKSYYKGFRTFKISLQQKMPYDIPNAGVWFSFKKDKKFIRQNSFTKNGDYGHTIMPFSWTPYSFEVTFDEDPDEVRVGIWVSKDRAWFDNIILEINGKPLTDLVFEILPND